MVRGPGDHTFFIPQESLGSAPNTIYGIYYVGKLGYFWLMGPQDQVPISGRGRYNLLPPSDPRLQISLQQNTDWIEVEQSRLPRDHPNTQMINSVLAHLAVAAGLDDKVWDVYCLDAPSSHKRFIQDNDLVVVHSGLFHIVANEDELAALLSSSTAWQICGFYGENITRKLLLNDIFRPFQLLKPVSILRENILNSQKEICNKEAEFCGLLLMTEAGFDPEGYVSIQRKSHKQSALEVCNDPKAEAEKRSAEVKWLTEMIPEVVAMVGGKILLQNSAATDLDTAMRKKRNWEKFKQNRRQKVQGL
ncbi:MAG: hypothetical protein Q9182_006775 [Xanthomendoza sp. 2 TL-2023]